MESRWRRVLDGFGQEAENWQSNSFNEAQMELCDRAMKFSGVHDPPFRLATKRGAWLEGEQTVHLAYSGNLVSCQRPGGYG